MTGDTAIALFDQIERLRADNLPLFEVKLRATTGIDPQERTWSIAVYEGAEFRPHRHSAEQQRAFAERWARLFHLLADQQIDTRRWPAVRHELRHKGDQVYMLIY